MSIAGAGRLQEGHPSGALILKVCRFAVKPVCDRRAAADSRSAWYMYTQAELDRTLDKDSGAPVGGMARTER